MRTQSWTGLAALALSASVAGAQICFYGGDNDFRNAMPSERNTRIDAAWTFDDFDWPGGVVRSVRGMYLAEFWPAPVAGDIAIHRGMGEGEWGERLIQIRDITELEWTLIDSFFYIYELELNVSFYLGPGTYHIGVRPVGTGGDQSAYLLTTSGRNSQGSPIGNDNAFFQSDYFGFPVPTAVSNLFGPGTWDFSIGVCGVEAFELALEGECPGVMRASVRGATPDGRVALIASAPGGCGGQTVIPPGLPCAGAILPVRGASLIRILTADGDGRASLSGSVGAPACGRVCLVALDAATCEVSNAAPL